MFAFRCATRHKLINSVKKHLILASSSARTYVQSKLHGTDDFMLDHDYLTNGIVSDDHAWFCGCSIDHHVSEHREQIRFNLQLQDYELLQRILKITKCDRKISLTTDSNGYVFARLDLKSKQLVDDLMGLVLCNSRRKSESLASPVTLLNKSPLHTPGFIRGVSDADGSFPFAISAGLIRWKLTKSSTEFLEGIQQLIYQECNLKTSVGRDNYNSRNGHISYALNIYRQSEVLEMGHWMYSNFHCNEFDHSVSNSMLMRKYNRYLLLNDMLHGKYHKSDRAEMLKAHKLMEHQQKIKIHNQFTQWIHEGNQQFNFRDSFKGRIDLMQKRYETSSK
eukprot:217695_1